MIKKQNEKNVLEFATKVYILCSVFLVFIFGKGGYVNIQNTKYKFFLCFSLIDIIFSFVYSLLTGAKSHENIHAKPTKLSSIEVFAIIYLFASLCSVFLSQYPSAAFWGTTRNEGFVTIAIYIIAFLIITKNYKTWASLKYIVIAAMSIFCIICIIQLLGFNPFGLYPNGINYYGADIDYAGAYIGTLGNADLVAALLCLAFPLCFLNEKTEIFSFFILIVLFWTNISAGIFAIIIGSLFMLPFFVSDKYRKKCILGIVAVVTVAFLLIYIFKIPTELTLELHEILHGNISDNFGHGRILIWKQVFDACKKSILFGYGPDTMSLAGLKGFTFYSGVAKKDVTFLIDIAHNEYLNILYSQGIIALCAYLGLIVNIVINGLKHSNDKEIMLLTYSIVLYSIQSFFSFGMCGISCCFWIVLAILNNKLKNVK